MNFDLLYGNLTRDLSYVIDYDYNTNYTCAESGCHEEGICRCGTLEDFIIKSVYFNSFVDYLFGSIFDKNTKEYKRISKINEATDIPNIDRYIIDRVLRKNKAYDVTYYYENISSGYYGEELDDIHMTSELSTKIYNDIVTGLSFSTLTEKVEWLLEYEYGECLEKHKGKEWKMCDVSPNDIEIQSKNHFDIIEDEYIYEDYNDIFCLCYKSFDKFKLIDGYHRLKSALKSNRKKIKILYYE